MTRLNFELSSFLHENLCSAPPTMNNNCIDKISRWYIEQRNYLSSSLVSNQIYYMGGQWLSGRVLDSRPKGCGFEPHQRHCVMSLSKNISPSLVLVQPRKTHPFITERLLMGCKESNLTYKQDILYFHKQTE